ncbi:MAG TPA: hypothetical protein VD929_01485 [Caulobacteraceae bacterium]|nr:hypothetical protein [Caulobacteraceae bacterium]
MKRATLAAALIGAAILTGCKQPSDEPENPAVDTTPMTDMGPAAGANSFTEAQARSAIEGAGYTNVQGLTKDDQGLWRGTATGTNGRSEQVSVDYRGSVTAGATSPAEAEAAAEAPAGATPAAKQ